MKKKNKILVGVLSGLLVVILAVCGITLWNNRQPVSEVVGDISWYSEDGKEFTIKTVEELYGLAELSKDYDFKGQTVKLGADIEVNKGDAEDWVNKAPVRLWTPITGFAGKFDGQGHTISGIYGDSILDSLGLFTNTQKSTVIKNLKLVNSCFKNNNDMGTGSIVGVGGGKLENIYSDALLTGGGKYFGGLVGRMSLKAENQITNCWFDGTITMKGKEVSDIGGIVGAVTVADAINVVEHSLSTADIVCMGDRGGGLFGNVGSKAFVTLKDSMYTGNLTYDIYKYDKIGSVVGQIASSATVIVDDVYTIDEIASRTIGTNKGHLNGSAIAVAKSQLLGQGGYQWTTLDFDNYWAAQKEATPILSQFAQKTESVAGVKRLVDLSWYDPAGATFEITTMQQLYGFAYLSRSYDFSGQTIKLGADIVVNEGNAKDWGEKAPAYKWTPIAWYGNSLSKHFKGTFDGQGHTVSGIYTKGTEENGYIGFFGEVYRSGTVKNFRLVNSYFEGTMASNVRGCVGSVAGKSRGTVEGVYSSAIVVNSAKMTGGIVGMITGVGENLITNCWFDGSVTGVSRTGGILGGVYGNKANLETTIEHCLNTGDIAVKIGYGDVGGMCGIAEAWSTLYVKDCLNAGTFKTIGDEKKANTHIGVVVGSVTKSWGVGSHVVIENSYGVKEFYSKILGWKYDAEGLTQGSAALTNMEEVTGYGGYQWTTLDFKNSWAVRTKDVPVPVNFATSRPSLSGVVRMVDYSWFNPNSDVYTIYNFQQLYAFAHLWDITNLFKDKTVKLGADIVVNEGNAEDWGKNAPALVWEPAKLKGTFDGQGHTISGIYVKGGEEDNYIGLFYRVYEGATVKNLKLINSYIEGTMASSKRGAVGSIAGRNNGLIDSVYSNAIVVNSARMTGGLVGMVTGGNDSKISNSWFDGSVTGITRTGGILGGVYGNKQKIKTTIEHCLNTGDIAVKIGSGDVGGICGMIETWATLYVNDSLNAGTFKTIGDDKTANTHIGNIVGSITKTDNVGSKVVMNNSYGVKEFYSKIVGWSYDAAAAVSQTATLLSTMEEVTGYGGYQWTTLDFNKSWVVRTTDVPVPTPFATSRPSLSGIARMVDYSWYNPNSKEYTIKNLAQLNTFAILCNSENDYFNGKIVKLGADITVNSGNAEDWETSAPALTWTPLNFKGTFDGQGKTLSGLYAKTTSTYTGLFNTVYSGAMVKNLKLVNSYFEGNGSNTRSGVGSVAGRIEGTIDTVYSEAIVKNSKRMTGGIAGMTNGGEDATIINCWFNGKIYATANSSGGILGGVYNSTAKVEHCLNTGELNVTNTAGSGNIGQNGGLVGYVESGTATLTLTDSLNAGTIKTEGGVNQIGTVAAGAANGCTLKINNTYGIEEFSDRTLGYTGDSAVQEVSRTAVRGAEEIKGYGAYMWTFLDFAEHWALRDGNVPVLTVFEKGSLNLEDAKKIVDYDWYDEDSDTYIISTKAQLVGFRMLCDADTDYFNGKAVQLGADIALNDGNAEDWETTAPENVWTPVNFRGTFGGDGKTISGVYVKTNETYTGFFGTLYAGATVTNLRITNSYFEGDGSNTRSGVGSVAGRIEGSIDTVYSDAILKNSKRMTGGIAGMTNGGKEANISNCWFNGKIYATQPSSGGILGGVYNATALIEHCLNTGELTVTNTAGSGNIGQNGGLCGYVESGTATLTVKDSLNAGTIKTVGGVNQIGTIAAGAANGCTIKTEDVYGIKEFSDRLFGYVGGTATQESARTAVRDVETIKGYGAYQWTTLDLEKTWVLKDGDIPMLAVFEKASLDIEEAKKLVDYSWYDESLSEYTIGTKQQLIAFRTLCNADTDYFKGKTINLSEDITLNEGKAEDWGTTAPENVWTPISFSGTFNGGGKTISGLYVKASSTYVGMFNTINSGAMVTDLRIVNSYIEGNNTSTTTRCGVGSVAGRIDGSIDGVYSEAIVKNSKRMTGGIAGMATASDGASITNCWFNGKTYTSQPSVGGILGGVYNATAVTVAHCLNTGELTVTNTTTSSIGQNGGLCGYVESNGVLEIKDSLNAGTIKTEGSVNQIGTISAGAANGCTLKTSNVYGTKEFQNKLFGYVGGTATQETAQTEIVELAQIKGSDANKVLALDFENSWMLRETSIPVLVKFKDLAGVLDK